MKFNVYFLDGPCAHKIQSREMGSKPDPTITCGGATYVYSPDATGPPGPSDVGLTTYAVRGGKYDAKAPKIEGETDVFKAWSQLHYSINHVAGRQSKRVSDAGRRIRRAVR